MSVRASGAAAGGPVARSIVAFLLPGTQRIAWYAVSPPDAPGITGRQRPINSRQTVDVSVD